MADDAKSPETEGGTGGSGVYILPNSLRNARLERRAIMQKWNIPEADLPELVNRQIEIAKDKDSPPRESTQAFLAVLKAREQDLKIEEMETAQPAELPQTTVNVQVNNLTTVQAALNEPAYLEYLRQRALEDDSNPGPVCTNGKPGQVANGTASNGHRPGANGSSTNGHG